MLPFAHFAIVRKSRQNVIGNKRRRFIPNKNKAPAFFLFPVDEWSRVKTGACDNRLLVVVVGAVAIADVEKARSRYILCLFFVRVFRALV